MAKVVAVSRWQSKVKMLENWCPSLQFVDGDSCNLLPERSLEEVHLWVLLWSFALPDSFFLAKAALARVGHTCMISPFQRQRFF